MNGFSYRECEHEPLTEPLTDTTGQLADIIFKNWRTSFLSSVLGWNPSSLIYSF